MKSSICIITPGHLASAPRVVKEADALTQAGHLVHVVAGRHFEPVESFDAEILRCAPWRCTRIDYRGGAGVMASKLLRHSARYGLRRGLALSTNWVARAHHAQSLRLGACAATFPADMYIGHCLAGLPAAAHAAALTRSSYGFDAEDFHDAETAASSNGSVDGTSSRLLQTRLLPHAIHLTAASPLIGEALRQSYGVQPTTVLNTFPLGHAPAAPVPPAPISRENPARLYWFSQTIGPGRGLEQIVTAMVRMKTPTELQLRGFVGDDYRARLINHARIAGLPREIAFLPPASPAEMARLAAAAHVGLSLEQAEPRNRDLCLTNKIFVYLLAGIPQWLSATAAQRALAMSLGDAALVGELNSPSSVAAQLDSLLQDSRRMNDARATAWRLGHSRFNWEQEQHLLIASVHAALGRRAALKAK